MSDINVALTTTRYIVQSDTDFPKFEIPICVATVGLGMLGFSPHEFEREEHNFSQICMNMAKIVHIDIEKQWVFIGEVPTDVETGLIDYTELRKTNFTQSFFQCWERLRTIYMEFQLFNPLAKNKYLFVLNGIWDKNHWVHKNIIPEPRLHIAP
jgi:hypothetical protein